ncbi:MAG: hypothetical protein JWR59_1441 [Brevundimonas sp.]|nr:hypothetical protein [Brevundimonas sp.]
MGDSTAIGPSALTVAAILDDPAASFTLKAVLRDWAGRDLVDAVLDARALSAVFEAELNRRLGASHERP